MFYCPHWLEKYKKHQQFISKSEHYRLVNFSRDERDYVTSAKTLTKYCDMSLSERAAHANNRFKCTKFTPYHIRKIYRQEKIKKKQVNITKVLTEK